MALFLLGILVSIVPSILVVGWLVWWTEALNPSTVQFDRSANSIWREERQKVL